MEQTVIKEIEECEERLSRAMLHSDVSVLDELLAPDLIFTNHLGHVLTKQDDLEAHRTHLLKIEEINLADPIIRLLKDIAVVSVQAHIRGSYADMASEADFRFTRVWSRSPDHGWHVVAGHSSVIA